MTDRKEIQTRATARVRVTLDVSCDSVWGEGCTLGQVYKQATDSAIMLVQQAIGSTTSDSTRADAVRRLTIMNVEVASIDAREDKPR